MRSGEEIAELDPVVAATEEEVTAVMSVVVVAGAAVVSPLVWASVVAGDTKPGVASVGLVSRRAVETAGVNCSTRRGSRFDTAVVGPSDGWIPPVRGALPPGWVRESGVDSLIKALKGDASFVRRRSLLPRKCSRVLQGLPEIWQPSEQ